ncbi:MAG: ABC transporter permease, partial [Gemmatimonadetes bacterium]|nr:ABC transporter permease [Gemmatimonadota bacterium]
MDGFLKDLRYAGRGLFRTPGVTVIAVVALALGIGLTTVMFSIVYGALHRGLPFDGADRIVHLERTNPSQDIESMSVPIHDYVDWNERQRTFDALGAFYQGTVNIRGSERPERFEGAFMTANTLEILGMQPLFGRWFTEEEASPGGPMVAVLGYEVWQDRYGGDRGVLGRTVTINGRAGEIIGVMPEGFEFPVLEEVWVPLQLDPVQLERGAGMGLAVFGRLAEGITVDQAMQEFTGIANQLSAEFPDTNEGVLPVIRPYTEEFIGEEERGILYTMLATVLLVLFIACANVANLLLARAAVRTRDVAIRTSLGASRWRVVIQLMAEAVVLTAVGAVLGTVIASIGVGMFARAIEPTDPPFWIDIRLDGPILGFVILASALAALVSGAIPAIRASSTDINAVLKDESRGSSSLQIGRLSRWLVVAEVAMSVALLVASGLMVQSVVRLDNMEHAYPSENVFTARIGLFEERFPDEGSRARFWDQVLERAQALPGVHSAALMTTAPGLGSWGTRIQIDGENYAADRDIPFARFAIVSPEFFETFENDAIQGRVFTRLDGLDAAPVTVVNESFVERFFPDGQAIGRRVRQGGLQTEFEWLEIVGVVPDMGLTSVGDSEEDSPPHGMYLPLGQSDQRFLTLAATTDEVAPLSLAGPVRDLVAGVDADTPIYFVETLETAIDRNMWFYGVFGGLFAAFGAAALFLASVGLYGVMSFSVSRRIQEMGIRMALGAGGRDVLRLVLRQGMGQIGIGMVLGAGLALLVARGLTLVIYDAPPWDPATWAVVFAVLG